MSSATEKKDLEEDEDEDEDFVLASKDVQELESLIYKEVSSLSSSFVCPNRY